MHAELSVALNFIISHLYNKLPRRRVDVFREELQRGFELRFAGHWYPEDPSKGSGFRCVKLAADKDDPVVDAAAKASGLDIGEIKSYLPAAMTIWIDPREVSCRLTENGPVQVIYRAGGGSGSTVGSEPGTGTRRVVACMDGDELGGDGELQRVCWGFETGDRISPSPGWSSSAGGSGGGTSPVGGGAPRALHPPPTATTFTAAMFAQTKFGSTKMKNHGPQRPSRLSPTEPLPGAAFPSRVSPTSAPLSACWGLGPTATLSPTGNRLSPMQQNASTQLGVVSPGSSSDAARFDWLLLQQQQQQQHHHQQQLQQMQYLAALKQQQQQQRGMQQQMTSSSLSRLASPHQYDTVAAMRQRLHLPQLHQPLLPHQQQSAALGLMASSPDVGLIPPSDATSVLDAALKDDGTPGADSVDWGLDMAFAGYASGLQQLLLAN